MRRRPVTDHDRSEVRRLHAEGLSRNDIARELGRSASTVTKIARQLGLAFDRTATAAATAAKVVDAKARRVALALALLDDAARLREQLWQPATIYNFGGRDNTYEERSVDKPPFADQLKILQATGIAVDRAVKLDAYDADPGIDGAMSMLGALANGLQVAYDQLHPPSGDE